MKTELVREAAIEPTPRVHQIRGLFDLPVEGRSRQCWTVELPIEEKPWHVGLIVGPSGSGKTTLARSLFSESLKAREADKWPETKSILDGFQEGVSVTAIVEVLSSVGFSSPPAWLRPFRCLSTGEQFRVELARMLLGDAAPIVCDEYTSVVD